MASIKLSADSINTKSQQVRPIRLTTLSNTTSQNPYHYPNSSTIPMPIIISNNPSQPFYNRNISNNISYDGNNRVNRSNQMNANNNNCFNANDDIGKIPISKTCEFSMQNSSVNSTSIMTSNSIKSRIFNEIFLNSGHSNANGRDYYAHYSNEFSLSSVGRSFIDQIDETDELTTCDSLKTPDTPTPNISPSSSTHSNTLSETFSNDFIKASATPSVIVSPMSETVTRKQNSNSCGSWDLMEIDLDFHKVNFDPCFGGDLEERMYFGGELHDPWGMLPHEPTARNSIDL